MEPAIFYFWKGKTHCALYKGDVFRRYPKAKRQRTRAYFAPSAECRQRFGIKCLHQEVWKHHHGDIPTGMHIHHRDGDPLNNDIANLDCVTSAEHRRLHGGYCSERMRANLDRIRPLAREWHRSEEGRKWHRNHSREIIAVQRNVTIVCTCECCGNTFTRIKIGPPSKYCSNKCNAAARRKSGIDNEQRTCAHCGRSFTINRYAKTKCCSLRCSTTAWRARQRLQSDGG